MGAVSAGFVALAAYLIGTIPTAYLAVRWLRDQDIRHLGDGNSGASNAARILGRPIGLLIGAVDIGKGLMRWDGVDTGVSHWSAGAFGPAGDRVPEGELAALMACLVHNEGGLAARDVSGHFWFDVDTEDDLRLADESLQADEHCLA